MKRVIKVAIIAVTIVFIGFILLNLKYKAVYLMPEKGGQLSNSDLRNHPEIKVVYKGYELLLATVGKKAIWIDKDAVSEINSNQIMLTWFKVYPTRFYPVVIVGYNDTFYSFRDCLAIAGYKGPPVDWKKYRLEPGFSVRMENRVTSNSFLKGYDQTYKAGDILNVTNALLQGKSPS